MIFAHKVKEPRKCRVFWLARHQKQRYLRCFFGPEGFQTLAKHRNVAVFGALRASPPSSTTVRQQAFELVFFVLFFSADVGVVTHYTQIRFYKQTTLRTAAYLCTDAFTHRRFYREKPLHRTAFTRGKNPSPQEKNRQTCV